MSDTTKPGSRAREWAKANHIKLDEVLWVDFEAFSASELERVARPLIVALEESNVCEACEGTKQLDAPCFACGGEDPYCSLHNHNGPEYMECPACDGRGTRSAEVDAALATAKAEIGEKS